MARYQILNRLAKGGMAEVFLGLAVGSGGFQKPVAVKRIHPNLAADADFVSRFQHEARLTVHLQHANVVQVFDLGQTKTDHLMVLEFVDGETLRALLRDSEQGGVTVPPHQAAFIIQQVAEGLAYAHEARGPDGKSLNIVHRDINPSNVLVSAAGEVKLADFGIARAALAQSSTATGVVRGKVGYFAPEVARGKDPDQRSDVFLMGLLLYEALTRKRLFTEPNFVKSMAEVSQFDVKKVPAPEGVPRALWNIACHALQPDPQIRLPSARAMSLKLSSWLFENRLRVGPNDIAQLFAKVFPQRRSSLLSMSTTMVMAEVDLRADGDAPPLGEAPRKSALSEPDFEAPVQDRTAAVPPPVFAAQAAAQKSPGKPPRPKLGDLLLHKNYVTPLQLEQGLKLQKRVGGKLGDVLVQLNTLKEDDLYAALAEQRGQRYVRTSKLESFEVPEALKQLLPGDAAQRLRVLPLSIDAKRHLYVAMVDPTHLGILDEVHSITGATRVSGVMIRPKTLEKMLERTYLGRKVDLDLPSWVGEQQKLLERFGATTSDPGTKSREQVFLEDQLGSGPNLRITDRDTTAPERPQEALDALAIGGAALGTPLAVQSLRLGRLVRAVAARVRIEAALVPALERQAVALYVAGQLERRRPFEPPHLATAKALLPGEDVSPLLTADRAANARDDVLAVQVVSAVLALGQRVLDLEAGPATCAGALVELEATGQWPRDVITALAEETQGTRTVAVIAAPGSPAFALVPAFVRAGFRVMTSTRLDLDLKTVGWVLVDASLQSPGPLEVVKAALGAGARVAAVASPAALPLVAAWRSLGDVVTLGVGDAAGLLAWAK